MVDSSYADERNQLDAIMAGIDKTVASYISGYIVDFLQSESEVDELSEVMDEVLKPMLQGSGSSGTDMDSILSRIENLTIQRLKENEALNKNSSALHKLDAPIDLRSEQERTSLTARMIQSGVRTDLSHSKGKVVTSKVDTKKLRKAEAKIAAKMEKRELKANYEASKLIEEDTLEDEFLMKVNPILDYTETKGKIKDIALENFDITFGGKKILTNAELKLVFGRRYGLIGKNGVGKSTLLRNISVRDLPIPTYISILHVEQEMAGDDTSAINSVLKADFFREILLKEESQIMASLKELGEGVSEDKDVESSKNQMGDRLNEIHKKLQEIESDKAESKAGEILSGLGFSSNDFSRPTRSFSGGWRMRLSLARALFCKPDLLLLDEPTNMLDIPAVVWLERYLQGWPNTLLVVSHDREFLDYVATDIIHQHSERLDQYKGNFSQFWATADDRKKNQRKEYEAQQKLRQHLQDYIDRWRYNAKRAPQAQSKLKVLEKLPVLELPEVEKTVTFSFPECESLPAPLLYMDEVGFGYSKEKKILSGVNINMEMKSRVAIVGPNGAGKTTMLKLLIGALTPTSGLVHRHGRLRIAYFSQHHVDQLDLSLTAVGHMAKNYPGKNEEEYRKHLGSFGISGMTALQKIQTLSGGQKSRVAFACLAVQKPHFIILDEPTNHLDMESIDALTLACKSFNGGVVLVSHDERFIDAVCTELWVCSDGKLAQFKGNGIKAYKDMVCPPVII
ncbi:putative ABC transporter ATP-binding protein [Smittium mucronatum]|uniref:Putative ABC transporter ATP-binding protein n=1 Tax=Smittium mucronatum TaxID=133383 RepID=A0A1R0GT60_9FUNG|nr:putative ABC transporter ATP-binding protein [Smittium mucronatum]